MKQQNYKEEIEEEDFKESKFNLPFKDRTFSVVRWIHDIENEKYIITYTNPDEL